MAVFESVHHPGRTPAALVVVRAQARPFAVALVTVMVVATAAALQGLDVLGPVAWAAPLAWVLASAWTAYDLRVRPAEVVVRGGLARVRSVWAAAREREVVDPSRMEPVFEPRRIEGVWHAAVGDALVPLRPDEWPDFDGLLAALRRASEALVLEPAS